MACIPPRPLDDLPRKCRIRSPLHQAIIDGRLHHFRLLIEKMGADVNAKDVYGWTPLTVCCLIDDEHVAIRCMKILTAKRVELMHKDTLQRTPLHYCCIGGKQKLARHLVSFETLDVHTRDCYGNTPLMYAAMRGRPSIVLLLTRHYVSSSSSVDERDTRGRTALMTACACGNYASAHILLTVGGAGRNRRDDVFFRSPAEWVYEAETVRDEEIRRENDPLVQLTVPLGWAVGQRDRRMTRLLRLPGMAAMYDRDKPFVCQHPRAARWRRSECFDELVRGIPEMFTHFHVPPTGEEERTIGGEASLRVLLSLLEDPAPAVRACKIGDMSPVHSSISVEPSHASLVGGGSPTPTGPRMQQSSQPPTRCISTPRLIELRSNPDRMMVPDLLTLFKMYVPRDVVEKKALPPLQEAPQQEQKVVPQQEQKAAQHCQQLPPAVPSIPNVSKVNLAQYH